MKVFKYLLSLLIAFQVCIGSNSNFDETIEDLLGDSNASLASDPSVTLISNGGIIGKPNSPTVDSASGVWSLNEQNIAASAGTWPVIAGDEDFELVTLILSTDSVDGGQNNTFTDSSSSGHTITRGGDTTQGSISVFDDYWSNYFAGGVGGDNLVVANTGTTIGTSDFTIEGWVYFDGIGGGTVYTILDGRTGGDTSNLMWAQEANGNWTILNGAGSNINSG